MQNLPVVRESFSHIPTEHEMCVYQVMAKQAVESKMYKGIGDQAAVMTIMLAARELNIPPMMALNRGINIINGSIEISARMMSALIRRAGHQIKIKECSDTLCVLVGIRNNTGEIAEVSYSIEDAQRAGLVKVGGGWTKNPKDMCFARAISRLSRQLFSDVIGIGYVEGEIKASEEQPIVPEDLEIEVQKEKTQDEWMNEYLEVFTPADHSDAIWYLKTVKDHFGWSIPVTIREMLTDSVKLMAKFKLWQSKKVKTDECKAG